MYNVLHAHIWRGCPAGVSIPHGELFPGPRLYLPSVLLTAVQSTPSYPIPGLLSFDGYTLRQTWLAKIASK